MLHTYLNVDAVPRLIVYALIDGVTKSYMLGSNIYHKNPFSALQISDVFRCCIHYFKVFVAIEPINGIALYFKSFSHSVVFDVIILIFGKICLDIIVEKHVNISYCS